jgi:hypothetical protein
MTKSKAFWASYWGLLGCYGLTAWLVPAALPSVGPGIVLGIAAAGGLYQAANVADNQVKGAHYRPELDKEGP